MHIEKTSGHVDLEVRIDSDQSSIESSMMDLRHADAISYIWVSKAFVSIRRDMRRYLHNRGCEVFFKHWGGEAMQRLAHMASPALEAAIQKIGYPAVVVAKMPAFGVCRGATLRLAPTMVDLALETSGRIEIHVGAWDVHSEEPFPSSWIEDVVPPDHPSVAAR